MTKLDKSLIANICYANVAGQFAMFCNTKYRGENFSWEWFIENCVEESDTWLIVNFHKKFGKDEIELAREYAGEIATTLVNRLS